MNAWESEDVPRATLRRWHRGYLFLLVISSVIGALLGSGAALLVRWVW